MSQLMCQKYNQKIRFNLKKLNTTDATILLYKIFTIKFAIENKILENDFIKVKSARNIST